MAAEALLYLYLPEVFAASAGADLDQGHPDLVPDHLARVVRVAER